jgi:hypothetical protein
MPCRAALQVGALGGMGLALDELLARRAMAGGNHNTTFGRARRVIMLFMWGGPAHQDTWDLKPHGPEATRGEFLPISTNVAGLHISEHFPLIARQADKLAIIRSVGQDDNNHSTGAHAGLTGRRHELMAESFGARESDFPHIGSVVSKLAPNRHGLPTFVALPEMIYTTNGAITPGQGGGLIGRQYDPFRVNEHPDRADFTVQSLLPPPDVALPRLVARRDLLSQFDQALRGAERSAALAATDSSYQRAMNLVLSAEARRAFDLSDVPVAQRHRYGWHPFGQSVLMARRLVEAGVKLVTVYWHREDKTIDTTWDTHALNFQELKNRLMPSVDRPIAALLEDLAASGMLAETLVVWNSEFGRTPNVNANAGRDHWGPCNSVVMAGGGIPGGQVYGATDEKAAYPTRDKVTQDDIAATIYHLLGLDPETPIHDRQQRPHPIALGQPIERLLGGLSVPEPRPAPAPRVTVEEAAPFTRMLRERGRRFLSLDFGYTASERQWELHGFSQAAGQGLATHRVTGAEAAVKYRGYFYTHFNYGWLVLRLAEAALPGRLRLQIAGLSLELPPELANAGPSALWQVPIPSGMLSQTPVFELQIAYPGLKLASLALLGDKLLSVHHERLEDFARV